MTNKIFFNIVFDKGRLKSLILWCLNHSGENKTLTLVEELKELGFSYATKAGLSIGIDDLNVPLTKKNILSKTEVQIKNSNQEYKKGNLTAVERFQKIIDTWHKTSEILKQDVIKNSKTSDILNPIYMMAFSGARGNISQVRQLVGMRGLMADPQGQILDFPIRSNFKEGLTLTEYVISCYGARKGLVDTALRTANSGYLTRRLVDVAQHIIVRQLDCDTKKGLRLTELKNGKKTILSLQNRLIGRVLAKNIENYAVRNQDISPSLASKLAQLKEEIYVRSPLTCEAKNSICQLCYGWSLAHGTLVSLGEAVGILAAQSIGEPGTQLTMRTFHTGGVFAGDIMDEFIAPNDGQIIFQKSLQGLLIRTIHGKIAFLTKQEGTITFKIANSFSTVSIHFPSSTVLYVRQNQFVKKKEILAQSSSALTTKNQEIQSKYDIFSENEGEIYFENISLIEKKERDGNITRSTTQCGSIWILAGKIYQSNLASSSFLNTGDQIDQKTILNQLCLLNPYNSFIDINFRPCNLSENDRNSLQFNELCLKKYFFNIPVRTNTYKKFGYFLSFSLTKDSIFFSNSIKNPIKNHKKFRFTWFQKNSKILTPGILFHLPLFYNGESLEGQLLYNNKSFSKNFFIKFNPLRSLSNTFFFGKSKRIAIYSNELEISNQAHSTGSTIYCNPFTKKGSNKQKFVSPNNKLFNLNEKKRNIIKITNLNLWKKRTKFFKKIETKNNSITNFSQYKSTKKINWIYFPSEKKINRFSSYKILLPGQPFFDDILFDKKIFFSKSFPIIKKTFSPTNKFSNFFFIKSQKSLVMKKSICLIELQSKKTTFSSLNLVFPKKLFYPRYSIKFTSVKEFYLRNKKTTKNLFYKTYKSNYSIKSIFGYSIFFNKQNRTRLFSPLKSGDLIFNPNLISDQSTKKLKISSYVINFSISLKLKRISSFNKLKIELNPKNKFQLTFGNKIKLSVFLKNKLIKGKTKNFPTTKLLLNKNNYSHENSPLLLNSFNSTCNGEVLKSAKNEQNGVVVLTNLDQVSFNFSLQKNLSNPPLLLGKLIRYGDEISSNLASSNSGQIIKINKEKITLRKASPILLSAQGVFHVQHGDLIEKNSLLATLFYQRIKTGDIVQGIPKIEELFEARQTKEGEILPENIHIKAKMFFENYKKSFNPQDAARKSIEKLQQILIESVQQVYQSQGVTIADKHIEIIVRQMTSKVKVIQGGRTGLLRGELVDLDWIEIVNLGIESQNKFIFQEFDLQKAEYEPVILGITKTSLETESFISAASFQETTRILSKAAIEQKTDFLRGLKENVILGHLIPAGTGFSLSFDPQISISGLLVNMSLITYRDMAQLFSSSFSKL